MFITNMLFNGYVLFNINFKNIFKEKKNFITVSSVILIDSEFC